MHRPGAWGGIFRKLLNATFSENLADLPPHSQKRALYSKIQKKIKKIHDPKKSVRKNRLQNSGEKAAPETRVRPAPSNP